MKRQREDEATGNVCMAPHAALRTGAFSYQSPLRPGIQRAVWTASNGVLAAEITPTKRSRDRSVPMDAMSRLMTAATSAARMKKRAQMTLTGLFGGGLAASASPAMACCSVCSATQPTKALVPMTQLQRCAHCERSMGACCCRECEGCASVFCSNCSTINCEEQYDRVFCLSCNYDKCR